MRSAGRASRRRLAVTAALILSLSAASASADDPVVAVPGRPGVAKSAAAARAQRRAYDGAPPVIPHRSFGAACASCHTGEGVSVEGVGFSPPSPHAATLGMSAMSRCRQCHVFRETTDEWRPSSFAGLRQDLRRGSRRHPHAPPVIPHPVFMRENCTACHAGPAAREEIRTSHPERVRCRQCHVERRTSATFARGR